MAKKTANKLAKKSWTVMVYMAGDNNLDPEGVLDLREMKKVGSTEQLNVVAQFDRAVGHVARRYYLRKDGIVTGDAVASLGTVNTGDPKSLTDFIDWGIDNYPADHYLLVLWNHGQGWDDTDIFAGERHRGVRRLASRVSRHALFRPPVRKLLKDANANPIARAILIDDNAKDFLDNHEMTKVLAAMAKKLGRKLDILGMDACLMSMAEIGYEISPSTEFTVGSEQTDPGQGWPYEPILGALATHPAMTPRDLGTLIVDKYLASYKSGDQVTYSACDLSKAKGLATAVTHLAKCLKASLTDAASQQRIQSVRNKVQSYEVADNIDLVDFCALLAKSGVDQTIKTACADVIKVVQTAYILKQGYKGNALKNSNGVAIYFPTKEISPLYPGLAFSKKTGWNKFLKSYLQASRSR